MNVCSAEKGADICTSSSFDARYPPSAIIAGRGTSPKSFWATTGCFPQECVIKLGSKTSMAKIKLVSTHVKHVIIDRCDAAAPVAWQPCVEQDVADADGLQTTVMTTPGFPALFLRLRITDAYHDFVTVRSLEVYPA